MSDFEQRLRDTVAERSEGFEPSADLPERIAGRVRRRQVRRRQLVAGGLVAAAAAVVVVVGLVATGGDDEGSIRMSDDDKVVTTSDTTRDATTTTGGSTTTAPPATSSSSTTSTTTATTTTPATTPASGGTPDPPGSSGSPTALDPYLTPLNRPGVGPIRAGMTLRQAQDAAGVTFVTSAPNGPGTCLEARFQGSEDALVVVVEPAGADPLNGVVRAVQGSVLGTDEGAMVGQSRAELLAALGSPTRTEVASEPWGPDGQLLVFAAGGYAYGALVADDMVLGLQSGDPAWVSDVEGCP